MIRWLIRPVGLVISQLHFNGPVIDVMQVIAVMWKQDTTINYYLIQVIVC